MGVALYHRQGEKPMGIDDLIKEMQQHGFITLKRLKILGDIKNVLEWISFMTYSKPLDTEQGNDWWQEYLHERRN